ncbi:UDP-N-acetylmuramoyl-L-alanine--D-glutamate ligase [Desulfovibrio sp. OttesenSCG-928-G15]|nr:UDP-N-acetylmuramoyl-L-alanine--D-glutamate ligase [Desulfovibrio sp. OttesenSCG-928-G15]
MTSPVQAGELAVVVGAGHSGEGAMRLLAALGAKVRLLDKNPDNITEKTRVLARELGVDILTGDHSAGQFIGAAVVVTSPGIPPAKLEPYLNEAGNPPMIAEMDLALRFVQEPIIAVTGTSGKTTTVSLAAAMLQAAGKKVFLGGNIGTPLSEYVVDKTHDPAAGADALVLEMSSFQLQRTEHLKPRVAVLLNLSPNHLDHHADMAEYTDAKFRIFAQQDAQDLALVPAEMLDECRKRGVTARLRSFAASDRFSGSRLIGRHNTANAEAAFLACHELGVSEEAAARAVCEFAPLRHRLEFAGEADGVTYVNDSKCTTVDAMRVALDSFTSPVLLLAGGKFKGGDLQSLIPLLREKVRAVALFGASREIFEAAWQGLVPLSWDSALPGAVARLQKQARPGEVILLSPATASYDAYNNYQERGDHFCALAADAVKKSGGQDR